MKNLKLRLKLYYFKKIIVPRYKKTAEIFGEMLSYSYMGQPVGFKKYEKKINKYMKKSISMNSIPWTYDEMANVGWGRSLGELKTFENEYEKVKWWEDIKRDQELVEKEQKKNFANVIYSWLKK